MHRLMNNSVYYRLQTSSSECLHLITVARNVFTVSKEARSSSAAPASISSWVYIRLAVLVTQLTQLLCGQVFTLSLVQHEHDIMVGGQLAHSSLAEDEG